MAAIESACASLCVELSISTLGVGLVKLVVDCSSVLAVHPEIQGSKIALVRSYLRVPQAAGQGIILIFLVKINLFPMYANIFVMQGKCLFLEISRPEIKVAQLQTSQFHRTRLCYALHSEIIWISIMK